MPLYKSPLIPRSSVLWHLQLVLAMSTRERRMLFPYSTKAALLSHASPCRILLATSVVGKDPFILALVSPITCCSRQPHVLTFDHIYGYRQRTKKQRPSPARSSRIHNFPDPVTTALTLRVSHFPADSAVYPVHRSDYSRPIWILMPRSVEK